MDCVFCKENLENGMPTVILREKGVKGIINAKLIRNEDINVVIGQRVHVDCRRQFTNSKDTSKLLVNKSSSVGIITTPTRSSANKFNFKEHCLFCEQPANFSSDTKQKCKNVFAVRTLEFQNTIEDVCKSRNDQWSNRIQTRLRFVNDLPAADAIYHHACSTNFRTGKQIPILFRSGKRQAQNDTLVSPGRPEKKSKKDAFLRVMEDLEQNYDEQVTISDLMKKMNEVSGDEMDQAYTSKHMKAKIKDYFGESVIISEANGRTNVITFKDAADDILQNFYSQPNENDTEENKERVLITAAKLIKNDIKVLSNTKKFYPTADEISSTQQNVEFVPPSLQLLLKSIFAERNIELKLASIGQCIMQATRPRGILAPLQLALGVQMHHQFGSKFLINTLNSLGYCSSYSEVKQFEMCAAATKGTHMPEIQPQSFVQYIADNVDHNSRTLDGHNTFHGMGMVAGVTPGGVINVHIPRGSVSIETIKSLAKINIVYLNQQSTTSALPLSDLKSIRGVGNIETDWEIDMLYSIAKPLRSRVSGWSGFMQTINTGNHPGKSSIVFLPMIDMNPSDPTCIYSTLKFLNNEALKHDKKAIITFDQPLYWKAMSIVRNEACDPDVRSIVFRLGGFHLKMSFLGSIGNLMANSGLQEALENIYAPNAVIHMMSGKAVSRAVRGHSLIHDALNAHILSMKFQIPFKEECANTNADDTVLMTNDVSSEIDDILHLYDNVIKGDLTLGGVRDSDKIRHIRDEIENQKQALSSSRTSVLWLQYLDMVKLLQTFIRAERTGNWILHLQTVQNMLPYFAASGHNLYLKSAYVYLQTMHQLEVTHPDIHDSFLNGLHVIRRSDRYWAGLSSDLVIEQVLMRSVKTTGGLTRGRGMTESQRAVWLLSMPLCADINRAMQDFTNNQYITSEQHKESTNSRIAQDAKDFQVIAKHFLDRNPFLTDHSLRSIHTGVVAEKSVNVDRAVAIGDEIVESMIGKDAFSISFKRSSQAVTLNTKTSIKIDNDTVTIDPQLLFQRLTTVANRLGEDVSEMFSYELSSYPSSLFDNSGFLREASKPALADAIWSFGDCGFNSTGHSGFKHIIDGGSLLYKIPWQSKSTFSQIYQLYVNYVKRHYHNPTIVFDGYANGPSTKDMTHLRRSKGIIGPVVNFKASMPLTVKKEKFLANPTNKQLFVKNLGDALQSEGCGVKHAQDDADCMIVREVVRSAIKENTVLVGEDTDLLVLLCYHVEQQSHTVVFTSDAKKGTAKPPRVWDIHNTQEAIGKELCDCLPFLHALTGCDTTSRLFGIGKTSCLKKIKKSAHLRLQAAVFNNQNSTEESIIKAGEEALVNIYDGISPENLDILRYRKYVSKIMNSTSVVEANHLPPTSSAALHHSKRVYLQTQQWIGEGDVLKPENWGWSLRNDSLVPLTCDRPPAPANLLKVIRCNCTTSCDTKRCSCRKHGLECSPACGNCQGLSCSNSDVNEIDIDSDVDDA